MPQRSVVDCVGKDALVIMMNMGWNCCKDVNFFLTTKATEVKVNKLKFTDCAKKIKLEYH